MSIYVPEGYRLGIASDIALGPARMWNKKQGIAFGSSPYRFPWFGAPFKKKSASQEDSYIKSLAGFSCGLHGSVFHRNKQIHLSKPKPQSL